MFLLLKLVKRLMLQWRFMRAALND